MTHDEINHAIEILNAIKEGKAICDADGRGMSLDLLMAVHELNTVAISENMNNLRVKPGRKVIPWTADDWREFLDLEIEIESNIYSTDNWDDLYINLVADGGLKKSYKYKALSVLLDRGGNPCGKVVEE